MTLWSSRLCHFEFRSSWRCATAHSNGYERLGNREIFSWPSDREPIHAHLVLFLRMAWHDTRWESWERLCVCQLYARRRYLFKLLEKICREFRQSPVRYDMIKCITLIPAYAVAIVLVPPLQQQQQHYLNKTICYDSGNERKVLEFFREMLRSRSPMEMAQRFDAIRAAV